MSARHEPEILYSLEDARRFIMLARRAHPGLGLYGFLEGCANQKDPLTADDETAYQVAVAATWIASRGRRKDMACSSSYGLKHVVESWTAKNGGKVYIPNGTFIAAAIGLGFKARQDWHGSPNARFSITNDTIKKESTKMNAKHKTGTSEHTHDGQLKSDRYGWKVVDEPGEFMWIDKKDIFVDHTYQREEKRETISEIRREWSWRGFGVVLVALRNDGRFYAFDGQNRVVAAQAVAEVTKLPCMVFTSENVAQEADAFIRSNKKRKAISTADTHRAMVVSGDEVALEAERLAKEANRVIGSWSGPNNIGCVGVLHKLIKNKRDPLLRVWGLLVEVCEGHIFNEKILQGIVEIESRLPEGQSLSDRRWRQRVASIGHASLLEAANRSAAYHAAGGSRVWAEGILQKLNKGVRVDKLAPKGIGSE